MSSDVVLICLAMDDESCAVSLKEENWAWIKCACPGAPKIIIGTKIDLRAELGNAVPLRHEFAVSKTYPIETFLHPSKLKHT